MTEALLIDIIVIALLGATIYFAFRLDRRLQGMRNVQHELATVIRELNTAAARAEAGIQGLKMAAQVSGSQLEEKIAAAKHAGDVTFVQNVPELFVRLDGPPPQSTSSWPP